jgi:hypothetical protein
MAIALKINQAIQSAPPSFSSMRAVAILRFFYNEEEVGTAKTPRFTLAHRVPTSTCSPTQDHKHNVAE